MWAQLAGRASPAYAPGMHDPQLRIDASTLSRGGFMPHGELHVRHQGRLIVYEARGPFNVEMVHAMTRAVGRMLQAWRPPALYLEVSLWQGSLLGSPAVLEAFGDALRVSDAVMPRPQGTLWLVPPEIDDGALMKPLWQRVYEGYGRHIEFFSTEAALLARADEVLRQSGVPEGLVLDAGG